MKIDYSERIAQLPPYLFVEIDRLKAEAVKKGKDVIDLGIGDPDIPTSDIIVKALQAAAVKPQHHRYPSTAGMLEFRAAAAYWMKKRYGVSVDPATQVIACIGTKEGIGHIPYAFVDRGDYVLFPDPGYPVYSSSTLFSGGTPHIMPLREKNEYLPDLSAIPADIARKAKLMFINYPNNPTAATATKDFFRQVVEFALKYNIIVCHDAAYSEVCFDGYRAPSFLEVDGAMEVGIEFHSLSKTFCMTGWRLGFAVGNADILNGLLKIKSNVDSGVFQAVQEAGTAALQKNTEIIEPIIAVFQERRDIFTHGIRKIGLECTSPKSTFYVWIKNPNGMKSAEFAKKLLEETALVLTPGTGFGSFGEGYIRAALTINKERLAEAVNRIKTIL